MKIDNNHKIKEWIDYSIGQSTVIQELDKEIKHKTGEGTLILKMVPFHL